LENTWKKTRRRSEGTASIGRIAALIAFDRRFLVANGTIGRVEAAQ